MEKLDWRLHQSKEQTVIAVNHDGSLIVFVNRCVVTIRNKDVVIGVFKTNGDTASACFVYRNGVQTILITDRLNICEITLDGHLIRRIFVRGITVHAVDFCRHTDAIAVSVLHEHEVLLMHYETPDAGMRRIGAQHLLFPKGIAFADKGETIVVADCGNDRISKFSVMDGHLVAHLAEDMRRPDQIVVYGNDGVLVKITSEACKEMIVFVRPDGTKELIASLASGLHRCAIAFAECMHGVVVATSVSNMTVMFLPDAWQRSSRCSWLSVCSC